MTLSSIREALRLLFANEDELRGHPDQARSSVPTASTPSVFLAQTPTDVRDDLIEVEMEVRSPGESAFFTRKVLLQQRKPVPHKKPPSKKPWEPGCWNCGELDHFAADCVRPKRVPVKGAPVAAVNHPRRSFDPSSFQLLKPADKTPIADTPPLTVWNLPLAISRAPVAVLDSACSANVAGELWMDAYISLIPEDAKALVVKTACRVDFAFGRDVRHSFYRVTVPEWHDGTLHMLVAAIIAEPPDEQHPLPFLLSRAWQKEKGIVIDHATDGDGFTSD